MNKEGFVSHLILLTSILKWFNIHISKEDRQSREGSSSYYNKWMDPESLEEGSRGSSLEETQGRNEFPWRNFDLRPEGEEPILKGQSVQGTRSYNYKATVMRTNSCEIMIELNNVHNRFCEIQSSWQSQARSVRLWLQLAGSLCPNKAGLWLSGSVCLA